jgi:hypothetical protein
MEFTRAGLEAAGFTGWIPLLSVRASACPPVGGVYVAVLDRGHAPAFAERSCGGWYRGDPTVSREAMEANWVAGAEVLYIGKAMSLRQRLITYAACGEGKPRPHWGGRLIWQLSEPERLLVAWRATPERAPELVEAEMLAAFRMAHGKPPFANDPHLLGR